MLDHDLRNQAILVAEDEYLLAQELAEELERAGATVVGPVSSLEDAVRAISATSLQGAVLDLRLQDGMAFSLADQLADCCIPFVFATGYAREVVPARHRSRTFFQKPFEISEVVRGLLDHELTRSGVAFVDVNPAPQLRLWNARVDAAERQIDRPRAVLPGTETEGGTRAIVARMRAQPGDLRLTVEHGFLRNSLLKSLPQWAFSMLSADLEPVLFERGAVIPTTESVYFLEAGIVSAVVPNLRGMDTGPIGHEGIVGLQSLAGTGTAPEHRVEVGGDALRMSTERLRLFIARCPPLAECLLAYGQRRETELADTVVAQALLSVEQRVARYLLAYLVRLDTDIVALTHRSIATRLGVRRASVTDAMHRLEGIGAIRNRRGETSVRSLDLLERRSRR